EGGGAVALVRRLGGERGGGVRLGLGREARGVGEVVVDELEDRGVRGRGGADADGGHAVLLRRALGAAGAAGGEGERGEARAGGQQGGAAGDLSGAAGELGHGSVLLRRGMMQVSGPRRGG